VVECEILLTWKRSCWKWTNSPWCV